MYSVSSMFCISPPIFRFVGTFVRLLDEKSHRFPHLGVTSVSENIRKILNFEIK